MAATFNECEALAIALGQQLYPGFDLIEFAPVYDAYYGEMGIQIVVLDFKAMAGGRKPQLSLPFGWRIAEERWYNAGAAGAQVGLILKS